MSDLVVQFNLTGECVVNTKLITRRWGKTWFISQWHDKYTLCHHRMKVQISKQQAKEIIVELDLVPVQSHVFRNAKTWYASEQIQNLQKI